MQVNQIRSAFLDFFKENNHTIVPSSSLIPQNDPTLMFTAAGMVQFKNYFTGVEKPAFTRAASSQKCVRAGGKHNDLENVGYTARHHTFFEMLGNFSFGDYFKEEAIYLAWKCVTEVFQLPKEKIYITVYHNDDEAFNIWKKLTGFSSEKIIRIPTKDNFWQMGEVGPCGPCTEIFYDYGDKIAGGLPGTPDADGDRYVEFWNLVFMQFEDLASGERKSLPKPSVDTGMGLERISSILQGKTNVYDIDLFQKIIKTSIDLTGNKELITSHRVIADHLRSSSFLLADGVMPSNEGRGYVLRRIMRRAMRHVRMLGYKGQLIYKLVPTLIQEMGEAYPELKRAEAVISSTLKLEEERFGETLDKGLKLLADHTEGLSKGGVLDGAVAFKLYDTYGFPLDLTSDILRAKDIAVDMDGFNAEMSAQKQRARAAWAGSGGKATEALWYEVHEKCGATEFLGYATDKSTSIVTAIISEGKMVDTASEGEVVVILNQTPFYGESGGQIGDTGKIASHEVLNTQKYVGSVIAHYVKLNGAISLGDVVECQVDNIRRGKIKANHSATHLLHKALRDVLGSHVTQKGSLVAPDRLRFDFSHMKALTHEEIKQVEEHVNNNILANVPTGTELMPPEQAISKGAMALFGEKYGDEVRVVSMGDSVELCGGTHVKATGDIGLLKIVSEEAIASGVRRIEAITGQGLIDYISAKEKTIAELAASLKCAEKDVVERVKSTQETIRQNDRELANLRVKLALSVKPKSLSIAGGTLLLQKLEDISPQDLKLVVDHLKNEIGTGVIAISSIFQSKVSLVIYVSPELTHKYKAGEIIKEAAKFIEGSGGGKAELAQAGGTNINGVNAALNYIEQIFAATSVYAQKREVSN